MIPIRNLLTATRRGIQVGVGPATEAELAPLVRPGVPGIVRDVLRPSFLVAIRTVDVPDVAVQVHALGWRQGLLNT